MKLKFIHSLVAVALIVGAAGSFSSCKDTDEDQYLKLQDQNTTLQEKMDAQVADLTGKLTTLQNLYNDLKAAHDQCCTDVTKQLADLSKELDDMNKALANGYVTKDEYDKFQQKYQDFIKNEYEPVVGRVSTLEGDLAVLENTIITIQNTVNKDLTDSINAHRDEITTLAQQYVMVQNAVTQLQTTVATLSTDLANVVTDLTEAQDNIVTLQGAVATLTTDLNDLTGRVKTLEDDVRDLKADVSQAQADATAALNQATANADAIKEIKDGMQTMNDQITWIIDNMPAGCDCDLTGIRDSIKANLDAIEGLRTDIEDYRAEAAANLATAQAAMMAQLDALDAALSGRIDGIDTRLDGIDGTINGMDLRINGLVSDLAAAEAALGGRIDQVVYSVNNLTGVVTSLGTQIDNLNTVVIAQGTDIEDLKTRVAALETSDGIQNQKIEAVENAVSELNGKLAALETRVAANEAKIQEVEDKVNAMTDRISNLENRISGVVIQQVSNPVWGSVNVPANIQSMILFNYWGNAFANLQFPDFSGNTSTNYGTTYNDFDPAKMQDLLGNIDKVNLTANQDFMNEEFGNMGKVYFTVNPTNVDLTGKEFTLENSAAQQSVIKLTNVRPCTETITFGMHHALGTNGVSANGFYVADATVTMSDVHDIRIHIENGLKGDVKDALKDRSLKSLASVAGIVFKQLNGKVPALGLKASWNEVVEGVSTNHSVYSAYSIAGTSYRPLSYGTAYGVDYSGKMPSLPDLDAWYDKFQNLEQTLLDKVPEFHFTNKTLNIDPITVNVGQISPIVFDLSDVTVAVDIDNINVSVSVTVPNEIEVYDEDGNVVGHVPANTITATGNGTCSNLDELNGAIEEAIQTAFENVQDAMNDQMIGVVDDINKVLNDISEDLQGQVNDMIAKINEQFDSLLSDLEKDVNTYIDDIKQTIQDEVDGRVESVFNRIKNYYDRVESVYNRIHNILADPNHYMQVTLLYAYDGGFGRMSNSKAAPTVFTGAGTATTLVPTTFNIEILSPAYLKYVAVTNVFDAAGHSAQGGDAQCIALLKAANNNQYMNTPVNGERKTVPFNFEGAKGKNCTFEIFYQALDYHGLTSSQKFYVTIK